MTCFYEAVQSIWFVFAFVRLCGNWPGIGRIDLLLGDYLKKDLAAGRITSEEAREILAHFLIKGCEWVSGGDYGSGDAQHYQNLVPACVEENGAEGYEETLYRTEGGLYFLYVNGGKKSPYKTENIKSVSKAKAEEWLANH